MAKVIPSLEHLYTKTVQVGEKTITLEVGRFSQQATAAVLAQCGETVVHATIVAGRESTLDYFPLQVEFVEKLYAGGRIKGSRWVKREGRPTDEAILKGRLIDRAIRPLFPKGLKHEVQAVATVLSADGENDADMVAMVAISAGLSISSIPWQGPIASVRVGLDTTTGNFLINPTYSERKNSSLDLVVAGSSDAIVMVEAGANEVPEEKILEAFVLAQKEIKKITTVINEMQEEVGKEKFTFVSAAPNEELLQTLEKKYAKEIKEFVEREAFLRPTGVDEHIAEMIAADETLDAKQLKEAFFELVGKESRRMILEEGIRPDGRKTKEIRQITCAVDLLPRTHGSAMFKRGATQVLSVTTLGAPSLGQLIEDMEGEEEKHYIHHYNMPPYASGEAGRFGSPKRREIGHGALAERAIEPMLPSQAEFPYTIHVVSEVMSSNGSTSQASVCGSTMSLMAAGVPLKKPVAGIAMGLMTDGAKAVVLSDIQGMEDHVGDMDFKVAGTKDGVTALQMDIKVTGLTMDIMTTALNQAKEARMFILGKMLEAIAEPRKALSPLAPKIVQLEIPQDRIGELIGPGGKMIKNIIATTGAQVDVSEDEEKKVGIVNISSVDAESLEKARSWISGMMRTVEPGEEFDGIVARIEKFGIFVEFLPGKDGLVHVSRMGTEFINDPHDVVKVGDTVHVRLTEVDEMGRYNLTMLTKEQEEEMKTRGGSGGGPQGGRSGGFSGGSRGGSFGGGSRGGSFGGGRDDHRRDSGRGERRFGGSRENSSFKPRNPEWKERDASKPHYSAQKDY